MALENTANSQSGDIAKQNILESDDKSLFNRIAEAYAQKDILPASRLARKYQTEFALRPVLESYAKAGKQIDTLLEVACGVGASATYLQGQFRNYIGVDYSEEMVRTGEWFNRDVSGARFIAANIKDVQLAEKADVIFAIGALHHMQDLDAVLLKIQSLAKPGAYFVALEPYAGNPIVQTLRFLRSKVDSGYSSTQRYFSAQELQEIFSRHRFTDIEVRRCNYVTPPFAQVRLPLQPLTTQVSRLSVAFDGLLDRLNWPLDRLCWNLALRCRVPK